MKINLTGLFVGLICLFATSVQAQVEFHHGAGVSYSLPIADGSISGGSPELSYHPRLAFEINRGTSFSVGVPVSLGFNMSTNSQTGGSGSLSYGLPLSADLNFGFGSMERSRSDFGGFVGVGYGLYGFTSTSESIYGGSVFLNIHGIYGHAGARFAISDLKFSTSVFTFQDLQGVMVYGVRVVYEFTDFR